MPFVEVASPLTGRRGVCTAFGDHCPPLVRDSAVFRLLYDRTYKHALRRRWRYIEIRGGREWLDGVPASTTYTTHELDLTVPVDKLFGQVDRAVRRNVRKAEREGVQVEISTSADSMKAYYDLHCATRLRLGCPPQPHRFFTAIVKHFMNRDGGFVALARHEDIPIAGIVVLHFGNNAVYKFGASDQASLHLRGNNLVMWKAIEHCAARGLTRYHFGRTSLENEGLRRFKQGWGSVERKLDYFRYDTRLNRFVSVPDRAETWRNRVICRMPLPWVKWLGAVSYPHLS
jgi:hypothetical protein